MMHTKMMKRVASAALTAALLGTSAFAADVTAKTDVNVRSGPDNKYAVVTTMRKGATTEKLGSSGNWIKVKVNDKTGYIYKRFLTETGTDSDKTDKTNKTDKTKTVAITANSLNVRSGPGTKYKVIGTLKKDTTAIVVDTSGDWYKIDYGKGYGYINKSHAKDTTKTKPDTEQVVGTKTVSITANSLNVRSGAGKNHKTIGTLKKNQTATVVDVSGDWYKIDYGNDYGYISKKYTKDVTKDTKTVTVTVNALYVRAGAGIDYDNIGVLKKGDKATVIAIAGDWYKINYKKGFGYISSKCTK